MLPAHAQPVLHRSPLKCGCRPAPAYTRNQAGAGSIEFLIIAVPLIFLGLGAFDAARWMAERQVLGLALQEAGRAGAVSQANPKAMQAAFEHAMGALFTAPSQTASQQRLRRFRQTLNDTAGMPPWQIEILSPTIAAYHDFSHTRTPVPMAAGHRGEPVTKINNYYLAEQDAHYRRLGRSDGHGPQSAINIFEANTLSLRLRYAYSPLAPGLKPLLRTLAQSAHPYSQQLFNHGYLPIRRDMAMMMHSHPGLWALPSDGSFSRCQNGALINCRAFP
ncbi:TadE/TadG family type IV pilus assembly protein [Allopusillimonas ginsengisoli]|uniref:TadE/TadG family type IV pilus assembly protein n=1 Tax=Allopusillimonas ginsengisoli TaxID=453575 RepID=UPI001484CF39